MNEGTLKQIRLPYFIFCSIGGYFVILGLEYVCVGVDGESMVPIMAFREMYLLVVAFACGGLRALKHPLYNKAYLQWLEITPWTVEQPLPLRRYMLGWPELVIAIALTFLGRDSFVAHPFHFPVVMLGAYLFVSAGFFIECRMYAALYAYAFVLFVGAFVWPYPMAMMVLVGIFYVVLIPELRESTHVFVWESEWRRRRVPPLNVALGYPLNVLSMKIGALRLPMRHTIGVSLLVGMLWFAFQRNATEYEPRELMIVNAITICLAPIIRFAIYALSGLPPISLRGRLATGRLVIPGYDRVLIVPAVTLLVGQSLFFGCVCWSAPIDLAGSVALMLSLGLTLGLRPYFDEWLLTGHHQYSIFGSREAMTERI
jgi:hypothetical protein